MQNIARESLRFRQTSVNVPGVSLKWEERSPALEVNITRYNNKIHAAGLNIEVVARASSDAAISRAQNVQNFYYELFYDLSRPLAGRTDDPNRRSIDQQVAYGAGVLHPAFSGALDKLLYGQQVEDAEALGKLIGKERFRQNPWILECPSIQAVAWEPNQSMFAEVGVRSISALIDVLGEDAPKELLSWQTSDTMADNDQAWQKTARIYSLETAEYLYTVCEHPTSEESIELSVLPNPAGRPWYVVMPGNLTSASSPAFAYQPLVAPVYPLVQKLNMFGTMMNSASLSIGKPIWQVVANDKHGAATFMDWTQMPDKERPAIKFDIGGMDAILPEMAGKHLELLPIPDMQYVLEAYRETKDEIDRWGFPPPFSPDQQVTAKSGYDRSKMQDTASAQLEPALAARSAAWRELFILVSEIIQGLKVPITIPVRQRAQGLSANYREAVTIKPDDFQDQDISVSFDATPASAKYSDVEQNVRLWQLGLISQETLMQARYDDWLAEQERIAQEKLGIQMDALADQDAMAIIQAIRPQLMQEVAAQEGLPLAQPQAPDQTIAGGPAPGQDVRMQRPPDGSVMPGLGAPGVPPPQAQNGIPPDLGQVVGAAP